VLWRVPGKRHHARAAFENSAKGNESRFSWTAKSAELLNPQLPARRKAAGRMRGGVPDCGSYRRFLQKILIERPISQPLVPLCP